MAPGINEDVLEEWDAIEDVSPKPKQNRIPLSSSLQRPHLSPREVIDEISPPPLRSQRTDHSQTSTRSPLDYISLEPSQPSALQKTTKILVDQVKQYAGRISHTQDSSKPVVADSDTGTNYEEQTDSSSSSGEDGSEMSEIVSDAASKQMFKLPQDSDTESAQMRREQRRRHFYDEDVEDSGDYSHNGSDESSEEGSYEDSDEDSDEGSCENSDEGSDEGSYEDSDEDSGSKSIKNVVPANPGQINNRIIDLISSIRRSSMLPSISTTQDNPDRVSSPKLSPTKSIHAPIPVSSSTNPSNTFTPKNSGDIQVRRTQLSLDSNQVSQNHLLTFPASVQSQSIIPVDSKHPATQVKNSGIEPNVHTQPSQATNPSRKRLRSPSDTNFVPESTSHKKPRLQAYETISPKQSQQKNMMLKTKSPHQGVSQQQPSSLAFSPKNGLAKATNRSMLSNPDIITSRQKTVSQHSPIALLKPGTTRSPMLLDAISFDHKIPQISASQPNPTRPRIRQQSPILMHENVTSKPTLSNDEEIQDSSSERASLTPSLDLEALRDILELQGTAYCNAVNSDPIYNGLVHLFTDFSTRYRTYLDGMNHLFEACYYLMSNRDKVDEDYWDDFILRHHQGEYEAWVNRRLMRFKEDSSLDLWYQQATKRKLADRVTSYERLHRILIGEDEREFADQRPAIPCCWRRFEVVRRTKSDNVM